MYGKGKYVNTKFDKTNGSQPLLCVTPLHKHVIQKKTDVQKSKENHAVSKPVTLQTSPAKQSGVNSNKNVIAPGMYKVVTTHESQTNDAKHNLSSTGMNAASSVRRPMNKDSHIKNSILANSSKPAKKVAVYVRKNKQTYITSKKTRFSKESTLSKSLDTTYVVSKPKINVGSTSKANDKVVQIVLWIVDSGCSKHMTGDRSLLKNFIEKFMGTVHFGNDNFAAITGYATNLNQKNIKEAIGRPQLILIPSKMKLISIRISSLRNSVPRPEERMILLSNGPGEQVGMLEKCVQNNTCPCCQNDTAGTKAIDWKSPFAPVARHEAVRLIIMAQQHAADVHPDELCPPNKRYDLMDANKKVDLEHVQSSSSVSWIYMAQFWHTLKEDGSRYRLRFNLDMKELTLTLDDFRQIFHLPQATTNNYNSFVPPPSFSDMVPFYKQVLGFTIELKTQSNFKTTGLLQPWQTLCKIFSKCLTTRVTGWDQPPLQIMQMLYCFVNNIHVDYAELL
ncbi:hypothetical protein Tco_0798962 [Tanacetum coccineum]